MKLTFLGATGTVTGSKYLLDTGARCSSTAACSRATSNCGCATGRPSGCRTLDAVVLTHAHIDHSGYLPLLGPAGFRARSTARRQPRPVPHPAARQRPPAGGGSRVPEPAQLLQAYAGLAALHPRRRRAMPEAVRALRTPSSVAARPGLRRAGPLAFGAHAGLVLCAARRWPALILFSGDIGRPERPGAGRAGHAAGCRLRCGRVHLWRPPARGTAIRCSSWRGHQPHGGARRRVVIPAFAVGRAQNLMYCIHLLKERRCHPRPAGLPRQPDGGPTRRVSTTRTAASTG